MTLVLLALKFPASAFNPGLSSTICSITKCQQSDTQDLPKDNERENVYCMTKAKMWNWKSEAVIIAGISQPRACLLTSFSQSLRQCSHPFPMSPCTQHLMALNLQEPFLLPCGKYHCVISVFH